MAPDPAARAPASHVVVDGSNIATEGRTAPSLAQLDEAVTSFIAQYGHQKVTVIVDATFGHRIVAGERPDYEEAVLAGELVAPPAGTIGRGDAFILQVARLANADVLSNDSFQELHAEHPWLFETGRLFGGKPVPEVGWVFVSRSPVKGPVSRRATQSSKKARGRTTVKASAAASAPMPVPTAPPPRARRSRGTAVAAPAAEDDLLGQAAAAILEPSAGDPSLPVPTPDDPGEGDGRRGKRRRRGAGSGSGDASAREPINDKLPYVSFVIEHPIGSVVQGVVERFSSHGAYVDLGDARGYVPLKALGDPPPRSAKEHFELGETRSFTVTRFDADLRGIDIVPVELVPALLGSEPVTAGSAEDGGYDLVEPTATEVPAPAGTGPAPSDAQEAPVSPAANKKKATARKAPAKKAATTARKSTAKATATKAAATAKKAAATAKKAAATAKKAAATARRSTATVPAKKKASAASKAPAKKAATAARSTAKAPAKKKATAARKAPAKKATATATKATAAKKKRAPARAAKKA